MVDRVENSSLAFFLWRIISTDVSNEYYETYYEKYYETVKQSEILGKKTVRADVRKKTEQSRGFWRRECKWRQFMAEPRWYMEVTTCD